MPLPLNYRLQYLHQQLLLHHQRLQLIIARSKADPLGSAYRDCDHDDAVSTTAGSTADSETTSLQQAIDKALVDALVASLTSRPVAQMANVQVPLASNDTSQVVCRNAISLSDMVPETCEGNEPGLPVDQAVAQAPAAPYQDTTPSETSDLTNAARQHCKAELASTDPTRTVDSYSVTSSQTTAAYLISRIPVEASNAGTGTQDSSRSGASSTTTDVPAQSIPSEGSALHFEGRCKPCAFFYRDGCISDSSCKFCHLCPEGEKKRRMKQRKKPLTQVWGIIPSRCAFVTTTMPLPAGATIW
jgi:hypothetical protein